MSVHEVAGGSFIIDRRGEQAAATADDPGSDALQDYLDGLRWDGRVRCESWLSDFFRVAATPYVREVAVCWLVQAVQRAFEPGCEAGHVLLLEGGRRKSQALRALAVRSDWYGDGQIEGDSPREASSRIQGKWIYDLTSSQQHKMDSKRLGDFVQTNVDCFRGYYGQSEVERPRRCVFAASIDNPSGSFGDIPLSLGGCRYFLVHVVGPVDVEGLRREAPQLWAEAVVCYRRGDRCFRGGLSRFVGAGRAAAPAPGTDRAVLEDGPLYYLCRKGSTTRGSVLWWGPGGHLVAGLDDAGVYTRAEALKIVAGRPGQVVAYPRDAAVTEPTTGGGR